eukprot:jgi/Phyca11/127053/e_gw1.66.125.1
MQDTINSLHNDHEPATCSQVHLEHGVTQSVPPIGNSKRRETASRYSIIVPTRFGLKYAPIPTLALEYEDDLTGVVDAMSDKDSSLYVYRNESSSLGPSRKLHVVELPTLTRMSETQQITRQLQQDNGRFLAPGVVP